MKPKKEIKLSCPFCGASGDGKDSPQPMEIDTEMWAVVCGCCGGIGPSDTRRAEAVAAWNGAPARALGVEGRKVA